MFLILIIFAENLKIKNKTLLKLLDFWEASTWNLQVQKKYLDERLKAFKAWLLQKPG